MPLTEINVASEWCKLVGTFTPNWKSVSSPHDKWYLNSDGSKEGSRKRKQNASYC